VPFGERRAAHFVRQITTGLAYLHEQARSRRSAAARDGAVTPLLARTRGAAPRRLATSASIRAGAAVCADARPAVPT
jgi:hypothetical protein